ncbi:hypothetical protein D4764_0092660 [Takifugu flavidus]|uniref:Uncharacterized protein n=1 Tax=Takifugu flavidus TaxID=433684 RepID=A0A5C6MFH2_9TELE|nr:hypothetical protein D4764_0092660 [Takifugu flavidus]
MIGVPLQTTYIRFDRSLLISVALSRKEAPAGTLTRAAASGQGEGAPSSRQRQEVPDTVRKKVAFRADSDCFLFITKLLPQQSHISFSKPRLQCHRLQDLMAKVRAMLASSKTFQPQSS